MAFIVENATGLSAANAYVSAAEVLSYLTERGRQADWSVLSQAEQEAAIIKATDYIETRFHRFFIGSPLTTTQALSFPREYTDAEPDYGLVPTILKRACIEYTVRAATAELILDDLEGAVKKKREKAGPVEQEIEYTNSSLPISTSSLVASDSLPTYPVADLLIEPLLKTNGGTIAVR